MSHIPREIEQVPIREANPGPFPMGDVVLGGGLALWVRSIELHWRQTVERFWTLDVHVRAVLPDRHDPSNMINVEFGESFTTVVYHGEPDRDDADSWVACRIADALRVVALHEAAESLVLNGRILRDPH